MKLTEMIKLGSKGFKPSDIKELEQSGVQTDDVINLAENGYSATDIKELITLAGSEEKVQPGNEEKDDPGPDPSGHEGAKDEIDYKSEFEKQKAELDKLKQTISTIQLDNSHKNLGSGEPDDDPRKTIQEAFKNLY